MSEITRGTDAVELRVDLLKSWEPDFISEQVYLLRKSTPLPIIYTGKAYKPHTYSKRTQPFYYARGKRATHCHPDMTIAGLPIDMF